MSIPLYPGPIIRLSSYLFGSIMRKYYTRQRLAGMVEIKVSSDSEHPGITVNCSELPEASVWIEITNSSPFHIIIHEIEAEFYLSGRVARLLRICNEDVGPSAEKSLFLHTDLNGKQVNFIKRNKSVDTLKLKINMLLSCRLSSFEINGREIFTRNIEFINCSNS